jgi:putative oxidoreductase
MWGDGIFEYRRAFIMKAVGASTLGHLADIGPLCMRAGIGLVFVVHGWQKFHDIKVSNFAKFLDSLGVPAPETVAWLQTIAEGVGGLLLIAGLMTRLVAIPLIGILIGAILLVKQNITGWGIVVIDQQGQLAVGHPGTGAELEIGLIAGLLGLLFIGPGRLSLDGAFGMETAVAPVSVGTSADRAPERA